MGEAKILVRQLATVVGERQNSLLLSTAVKKRLVLQELWPLCIALHCSMFCVTCHATLKKIAGQAVWQIALYSRTIMNTSVYLVNYGGLLGKTKQKLCLCLFICVLLCAKKM